MSLIITARARVLGARVVEMLLQREPPAGKLLIQRLASPEFRLRVPAGARVNTARRQGRQASGRARHPLPRTRLPQAHRLLSVALPPASRRSELAAVRSSGRKPHAAVPAIAIETPDSRFAVARRQLPAVPHRPPRAPPCGSPAKTQCPRKLQVCRELLGHVAEPVKAWPGLRKVRESILQAGPSFAATPRAAAAPQPEYPDPPSYRSRSPGPAELSPRRVGLPPRRAQPTGS